MNADTLSKLYSIIDENINLDEPISDIGMLVNSVTNAGDNLERDTGSSTWTFMWFYYEFAIYPSATVLPILLYMNDLCKSGNEMTDQY